MSEDVMGSLTAQQRATSQQLFMACGQLVEEVTGLSKLEVLSILGYYVGSGLAAIDADVDVHACAANAFPAFVEGYENERNARAAEAQKRH